MSSSSTRSEGEAPPYKAVPVGSSSTSGEETDTVKRSDSKLRKSLTEKGDKS